MPSMRQRSTPASPEDSTHESPFFVFQLTQHRAQPRGAPGFRLVDGVQAQRQLRRDLSGRSPVDRDPLERLKRDVVFVVPTHILDGALQLLPLPARVPRSLHRFIRRLDLLDRPTVDHQATCSPTPPPTPPAQRMNNARLQVPAEPPL